MVNFPEEQIKKEAQIEQEVLQLKLPIKPFVMALGVGLLSTILYPIQFGLLLFPAVLAVALTTASTALTAGFFFGFLFGIPRTLQSDRPEPNTQGNGAIAKPLDAPAATDTPSYSANTNLEQISDWLTKILVGVSLTQIGPIARSIHDLTEYLRPGLGNADSSSGFALTLLVYFFLVGFLFGFLWTRLALPAQFASADREVVQQRLTQVNADISGLGQKLNREIDKDKKDTDAKIAAFKAVATAVEIPVKELSKIFSNATDDAKLDIFTEAVQARSQCLANLSFFNRQQLRGIITVLEALTQSGEGFLGKDAHVLYAELGFSLKDKMKPSADVLGQAIEALDEAIDKRGPELQSRNSHYEFNRGMARILDPARRESERELILADLSIAAKHDYLTKESLEAKINAPVREWLETNKERLDDSNISNVSLADLLRF